ncbi:phage tail protein [Streptomyces sp. YC504]|uniref:Phage tail protein n=1 Tax=Streptomyces mesophilus TaxID=1775132 RepID=A0A6G4XEY8_9ACTN|nr:phage baseplate assembly protein V [Streptomyces mesophilus]NGO75958.1 phage tail protein [Streptomyces mesophilus]
MQRSTLVTAIVDDLDDPLGLGRIRVRFPLLDDQVSNWARLVSAGAGNERGAFFRPEFGDEVIVGFEHDDPRRPYVLGGVWSVPAPPPPDQKATDNNLRQIVTRSGHVLCFDDGKGAERIRLVAAGGDQEIVLETAKGRIEVTAKKGDIVVKASAGTVEVTSSGNLTVSAGGDLSIKATGALKLSGSTVDIN